MLYFRFIFTFLWCYSTFMSYLLPLSSTPHGSYYYYMVVIRWHNSLNSPLARLFAYRLGKSVTHARRRTEKKNINFVCDTIGDFAEEEKGVCESLCTSLIIQVTLAMYDVFHQQKQTSWALNEMQRNWSSDHQGFFYAVNLLLSFSSSTMMERVSG